MLLAAESDDLALRPGSEGQIYASILSGQLSQSERMWCEFMRGERLGGSRQLVSLGFRPARNRPQRIPSAVAVATGLH